MNRTTRAWVWWAGKVAAVAVVSMALIPPGDHPFRLAMAAFLWLALGAHVPDRRA